MTELKCPSCGGKLTPDSKNPNIEFCSQCSKTYTFQKIHSEDTGEAKLCLTPVPDRIAYQPLEKKEPKKTGWEPYGWKRGVALVILFFVLMGIMYGPKIYARYQMDHGGGAAQVQQQQEGQEKP